MIGELPVALAQLPPGWPLLVAAVLAAIGSPIGGRVVGLAGLIATILLHPLSIDRLDNGLTMAFATVCLAGLLFVRQQADRVAVAGGLAATGAAIAAVNTATLPGLMIWTEVIAIASALIVMAGGTPAAVRAGFAYLLWQVLAGVLLMIGLVLLDDHAIRSLPLDGLAPWLILVALGIKAALPPFQGWLIHAYPAASPTGSIFLSAFATKVAIVALARLFAGHDLLIWVGLAMMVVGVLPTLFERDWRRLLAWALVSQLGVMVIGIGLGSPLALAGVGLLAIGHVIYASLLFVAAGILDNRQGRAPFGLGLICLAGTLSIGLPGLAGYGGKAMIGEALIHDGFAWIDYAVVVVGAIVFVTAGLRPLIERCWRPAADAPRLNLGEALAAVVLLAAGITLGTQATSLTPYAGAAWLPGPLILQGIALGLATILAVLLRRRLPPQRDHALAALALPTPPQVIGAVQGISFIGRLLTGIGTFAERLIIPAGGILARSVAATARILTNGGVGDGVLWVLALLTVVLIVSFG